METRKLCGWQAFIVCRLQPEALLPSPRSVASARSVSCARSVSYVTIFFNRGFPPLRVSIELTAAIHPSTLHPQYDDIPVETSGENVPDPIEGFEVDMLGEDLMRTTTLCGYSKPTPVQKYSIPIGISNRDLMACAQTGSGKTAGFLFPTLISLLRRGGPQVCGRGMIRALGVVWVSSGFGEGGRGCGLLWFVDLCVCWCWHALWSCLWSCWLL